MRHPTARTRPAVARWRAALVGALVAGLAMAGAVAGVAAPAAAEEAPAYFDSTLEIVRAECDVYGGPGVLEYIVRDPATAYADFVTVTDSTGEIVHSATYWEGDLTEFRATVALPQGSYTIDYTAGGETNPRARDSQTFTITCPDLELEVTTTCSTGADGVATFAFAGLIEGEQYGYDVVGPDNAPLLSDGFEAGGPTDVVTLGSLPPGNYYVYAQWQPEVPTIATAPVSGADWRGFAVEPCQPVITVSVTQCAATGGTGSALVTLSDLVAGVEYDVRVTDAGDPEGTPYGGARTVTADEHGTAQLSVSKLPPGADFTVWATGLWSTTPWEEPPFIGNGGNFTPIETVDLLAQADFTAKPCPVTLAATGVSGVGALVAGALVLLGVGGATLFVARRRRGAAHESD